jgi:hypothetical protein
MHGQNHIKSKNTSLTEVTVLICTFIHFLDYNFVEVETYRTDIIDKWLFITDCAVCLIKHTAVNLLSEIGLR